MKYGILADIHSNLEALESVLADLGGRNVDELLCLGDIVGYGADPAECLRLVRENCGTVICGNHDYGISDEKTHEYFNPDAREALLWTEEVLSEDEKDYLKGLEIKKTVENCLLVHSSPLFPREWKYVYDTRDAGNNFFGFDEEICFLGHTHVSSVFTFNEDDGSCRPLPGPAAFLTPRLRYMINPGSVGQPRDGNPEASFAVFDSSARELEIVRTPYDFKAAAKKIIKAGLPRKLGMRLGLGA